MAESHDARLLELVEELGGGFTAGLPAFLAVTADGCSASGVFDSCMWTLSGVAGVPAGVYTVRVTVEDDDGGATESDLTITVEPEDATLRFPPPPDENQVAWQVDGSDGDISIRSR